MQAPVSKLLLALAVSAFTTAASAAQPIEGFRGVRWGDPVSSIPDAKPTVKFKGQACYQKAGEKLSIGDATLSEIQYCFYKDRFATLLVSFPSGSDGDALKLVLTEAYGQPDRPNRYMDEYQWRTSEAMGILDYRQRGGVYVVRSLNSVREQSSDEKERAKDATGDL